MHIICTFNRGVKPHVQLFCRKDGNRGGKQCLAGTWDKGILTEPDLWALLDSRLEMMEANGDEPQA
jgi:hypothetical protein